ncbi:MAG: hypothetical protein KDE26_28440 [Bacteroidetes bacterium]|nr:hypothetical protein [Bacteroidota bacterium]
MVTNPELSELFSLEVTNPELSSWEVTNPELSFSDESSSSELTKEEFSFSSASTGGVSTDFLTGGLSSALGGGEEFLFITGAGDSFSSFCFLMLFCFILSLAV